MHDMPCRLSPSSNSNRASLSVSFKLAVGSSRISSLISFDSAFAISMSCCLSTPRFVIRVLGDSCKPIFFKIARVFKNEVDQSITPKRDGSLPRKMFSVMDSRGTRANFW